VRVVTWGQAGPPAVLIHGSGRRGVDTFARQRDLALRHRIHVLDRAGYGSTPRPGPVGWTVDDRAVVDLLSAEGGGHVVGHGYGAVVALVVASARPDLVRSLVVIEPPLFDLIDGDALVRDAHSAVTAIDDHRFGMSAEEYHTAWTGAVLGWSAASAARVRKSWTPIDRAAFDAARREVSPRSAPIDLDTIGGLDIPRVVVVGGWPAGPQRAGRAFRAVAEVVADRLRTGVTAFADSGHDPQLDEPEHVNALLRTIWS
jgi:pimeloyl-ACP methyl ester carboxylesterase